MSFSPEDSAIKMDTTLEERIHAASSQFEIAEILREAAVAQNLVVRDKYSPDILLPAAGTPKAFATTITVSGQKHIVEGKTEAEMNENLIAFYKQQLGGPAATEQTAERPRDSESGRFVAARTDDPVAAAELELKFKRGELSSQEYLEQSGAIRTYLESQGVPLEELRASVDRNRAENEVQSWQSATTEFLNSPEGRDWPGTEANKNLLAETITQMGATDSPSAENIAIAYRWLKENGKLLPNPEIEARKAISSATSVEEIRTLAHGGSSVFGR